MEFKKKLQEAVDNHNITDHPRAGVTFGGYWEDNRMCVVVRCKFRTLRIITLFSLDALPDLILSYDPECVFLDITQAPSNIKVDVNIQSQYYREGYKIIVDNLSLWHEQCLIEFFRWIEGGGTVCREIQLSFEKNDITFKAFLMSFLDSFFK